jgi:acetylornithine deacetylase
MDDDPIALLSRLVAIDSVNPDLVQGGRGEAEIATFVSDWLSARGFEVQRLEARPGRPSIVGRMRGSGGGPSLMFNGHLDTVGHFAYDGDALSGAIIEDKLHGRGSNDMKGGVAAMLVAAARAGRRGLKGDVIVACVSDEEYAGRGTEEVVAHVTADAAIVTEPTQLALLTCHKGFAWFDLVFHGRAAHGSRPDLGIDAIAMAGRVLAALEPMVCGWRPTRRTPS